MHGTEFVHIVDDEPAVRDSLRFLLQSAGFDAIAHESADAFLAAATAQPVGCVLTDLRMPGTDGIELLRRLRAMAVPAAVVVMTGHGEVPAAVQAMKQGALDFIEKPFNDDQLVDTVRRAFAASRMLRQAADATAAAASRLAALTNRERDVLEGLVAGLSSKGIANQLGTSPRTVEVHRIRVMAKLQVHSLPELVRLVQAAQSGAPPARQEGGGLRPVDPRRAQHAFA
jgi:two-component system response regulator FixJ